MVSFRWCVIHLRLLLDLLCIPVNFFIFFVFFFNDTATTGIYTLSLHDALPIYISDRITVKASGNAKLGFSRDFYVEAISHRINSGGQHTVSYSLSDTGGFAGFWVIGKAKLGIDTRLTY